MKTHEYQPLVHRFAVATTVVALLPIAVGALVTSMKAGMAFRDWPSSDGQFMLTYPWFADFARGAMDKFVEHGHRLAGMLIGVTSIVMTWIVWRREPRMWVRLLAASVLACVVVQGLLGGGRVLANDPRMAMAHGNFAAIVFSLMAAVALVTSRGWMQAAEKTVQKQSPLLKPLAVLLPLVIYVQFLLGGRQRHLHDMLYEHMAMAALVFLAVILTSFVAFHARAAWLWRPAGLMLVAVLIQAALGFGAWITKYGFPPSGYVAVIGAPVSLLISSSHTVVGMLLLMNSIVFLLRLLRLESVTRIEKPVAIGSSPLTGTVPVEGGAV